MTFNGNLERSNYAHKHCRISSSVSSRYGCDQLGSVMFAWSSFSFVVCGE